jgi:hypothetical protein
MVLSRIAVHHCGLSGPQQPGTRTLIHVFSLLSQLVRTQTKQCSIRFHMEPSGRSRSQIGPTTGSGFCLDAASCRSVALSRVVAAGSNIIRAQHHYCGLTSGLLEASNIPNPNRQGVHDRFSVIPATQPLSRRSAWIATSHRGPWLLMPLQAPSDCSRSSPV